eukprot:15140160-Alexandrium_andersonii.AAC.1
MSVIGCCMPSLHTAMTGSVGLQQAGIVAEDVALLAHDRGGLLRPGELCNPGRLRVFDGPLGACPAQ